VDLMAATRTHDALIERLIQLGPADALHIIVEYLNIQCDYYEQTARALAKIGYIPAAKQQEQIARAYLQLLQAVGPLCIFIAQASRRPVPKLRVVKNPKVRRTLRHPQWSR
jgi:hypothetical protein